MAAELDAAARPKPSFKSVELLRDDVLGIGAYGKVYKARCDELICAAKVIHETLIVSNRSLRGGAAARDRGRLPIDNFIRECDYLSTIQHPNIVQYLGQCQDPHSGLPVLLMELLDATLTGFVEDFSAEATVLIPFHIQVNICHDISIALAFLHSNGIVHRDLSGKNVLMIGNVRAKVSDFGMARLMDLSPGPGELQHTLTKNPGTNVYMPPEAVTDPPVYSEKIDCFSLGVIILQLLTRKFPAPGHRNKSVRGLFGGRRDEYVPEVERRQNHINEVDSKHPLRSVLLDCLKDKSDRRPTSQQLCQRLAAMKESSQYRERLNNEPSAEEKVNGIPSSSTLERVNNVSYSAGRPNSFFSSTARVISISSSSSKTPNSASLSAEKSNSALGGPQKSKPSEMEKENEVTSKTELQQLRQQISKITAERNLLEEKLRKLTDQNVSEKEEKKQSRDSGKKRDHKPSKTKHPDDSPADVTKDDTIPQQTVPINEIRQVQQLDTLTPVSINDDAVVVTSISTSTNTSTNANMYDDEFEEITWGEVLLQEPEKDKSRSQENGSSDEGARSEVKTASYDIIEEPRGRGASIHSLRQGAKEYRELCAQLRRKRMMESIQEDPVGSRGGETHKGQRSRQNVQWRKMGELPFSMERKNSEVAVNGSNNIYITCSRSKSIHAFNTTCKELTKLPDCPQANYSLAVLDGLPTTIGGNTNKLFSLTGRGVNCRGKWTEEFPPMPSRRQWTTALRTSNHLIVAGGWTEGEVLKTVEVLNLKTRLWSTAADLPEPLCMASGSVCDGLLVIAGGQDKATNPMKVVFVCSLEELITSTTSSSSSGAAAVWSKITDLPTAWSTCILIGHRVLAIGLSSESTETLSAVHKYNATSKSWDVISDLSTKRCGCFALRRSNNRLLILGGGRNTIESTDYNVLVGQSV